MALKHQYKFLGITLDPKLFFIPHIKQLRIKCNPTIQPLRTIAHIDWGADKKTLTKLQISKMIKNWLQLLHIWSSQKILFQRTWNHPLLHYQGLHIVLGAFTTSPIESLYIEANKPPLFLRRYKISLSNTILNSLHAPKTLPITASWK